MTTSEPLQAPGAASEAVATGSKLTSEIEVGEWHRVSPKYAWAMFIFDMIVLVVLIAGLIWTITTFGFERAWIAVIALSVLIIFSLAASIFAFRRVRSIGYIFRSDDFVFRTGVMWERVVSVPYGRLQLVDINRGPILRMLGLSELKFETAATVTQVKLPGLTEVVAEQVRDRLIELSETRRSGL